MFKKIYFLILVLLSQYSHSYPAQAELFGLSKSMVQVFVTFKGGVTGSGSGIVIKDNHVVHYLSSATLVRHKIKVYDRFLVYDQNNQSQNKVKLMI